MRKELVSTLFLVPFTGGTDLEDQQRPPKRRDAYHLKGCESEPLKEKKV